MGRKLSKKLVCSSVLISCFIYQKYPLSRPFFSFTNLFYPNLSKTVLASNDLLDLDMSGQNTLNNLMAVHTAQQQQQHQTQNIMAQFNQVVSVFVPETKFALARRCEYVGPAAAQPVYDKPNATDLST
jgi:hypothetical protein